MRLKIFGKLINPMWGLIVFFTLFCPITHTDSLAFQRRENFSSRCFLDSLDADSVTSYHINLHFDATTHTIRGHAIIRQLIPPGKRSFLFSLNNNLTIDRIILNANPVSADIVRNYPTSKLKSTIYKIILPDSNPAVQENTYEITYSGTLNGADSFSDHSTSYFEFGEEFQWFPMLYDDYKFLLHAEIVHPPNYSPIFSYEGEKTYDRSETIAKLRWDNPIYSGGFCLMEKMKKAQRNFSGNHQATIHHSSLTRSEVDELLRFVEYIIDRFDNLLGQSKTHLNVEIICLPKDGPIYRLNRSQIIIPERAMKFPLYDWNRYHEVYFLVAQSIADSYWANCSEEWMREALSRYSALVATERMFGFELTKEIATQWENQFVFSLAHFHDLAIRHQKEALYTQKIPFVLRMLSHQMGGIEVDGILSKILKRLAQTPHRPPDYASFRQMILEETGIPYDTFFEQWIETLDIPKVAYTFGVNATSSGKFRLTIDVLQRDGPVFTFPLDFVIQFKDENIMRRILIPFSPYSFSMTLEKIPQALIFCPGNYILNK